MDTVPSVIRRSAALLIALAVTGGVPSASTSHQASRQPRCQLPEPTVIQRDGNAVLQRWELPAGPVWFSDVLPDAPGYVAYRAAIQKAGSDHVRPVADLPTPKDAAERELWRRESLNVALMYSGGGDVRAVRCLEAALFTVQDARYSQLTQPTEFIAHVLRRDDQLRVYFGGSDQPFPPKGIYALEEVAVDVAAGWHYWVVLHNHPLQRRDGQPALGVPAPSTSDVDLFRGLVALLGLREVWVTNGMYTGVVPSANLLKFSTRD